MSSVMPRPRCVADLVELERRGRPLELLLFWGHQPPRTGGVGTGCLSQRWEAPFTVDGTSFPTAEHFMMVQKARLFGDEETTTRILAAGDPRAAKAFGRQVRGFDEDLWASHRYDVVVRGSTAKFAQNRALRDYLLVRGWPDRQAVCPATPGLQPVRRPGRCAYRYTNGTDRIAEPACPEADAAY